VRPYWGGWGRTSNLPVNSRALCQLSYTPRRESRDSDFTRAPSRLQDRAGPMMKGLVLAAGAGVRFGGGKLHALYRGQPLLAHVLGVILAARERGLLQGGHVVVAATDGPALALVQDAGLEPVVNDSPDLGLSYSLRLGLASLESQIGNEPSGALVFLGDQPQVRVEVVEQLVDAWRQGKGQIIRPRYADNRDIPGHPVLLSHVVWPLARQLEGDRGWSALLEPGSPELVTVDVPGSNPDVDTRVDLQALER
jgi:molybdenum cofactor cytidylyltransferase